MKRLLLPFLSLTGILWLTAGWLAWVIQNGVGMLSGIVLGGIVALAAINLLRTCVSIMPARTFLAFLTLSLLLFSTILLLRWQPAVWQRIVQSAAFVLALVGLTIGVDKLTGRGWQFTQDQLRGLLAGSILLVAAAYLLPGVIFMLSITADHAGWLSKASLLLASFRFP
ncbi:hypothetical protein [Bellilinea sp.]|jgi:hypothetical protein|uniref:Uncharacterized protein n=1 Tax=Bellilinea caldifistulae TaxID=360411 RepID=A0A7C4Q0S9_9CHLR|nr:hypothetical protein [Bellilinea sp.]